MKTDENLADGFTRNVTGEVMDSHVPHYLAPREDYEVHSQITGEGIDPEGSIGFGEEGGRLTAREGVRTQSHEDP